MPGYPFRVVPRSAVLFFTRLPRALVLAGYIRQSFLELPFVERNVYVRKNVPEPFLVSVAFALLADNKIPHLPVLVICPFLLPCCGIRVHDDGDEDVGAHDQDEERYGKKVDRENPTLVIVHEVKVRVKFIFRRAQCPTCDVQKGDFERLEPMFVLTFF